MNKTVVLWGIGLILSGVVLGAFGAHALKEVLTSEKLISYEVGVRYQFYHGLGLLLLGLFGDRFHFSLKWIIGLMITGLLLFSVSIYFLAIQDLLGASLRFLGPITPIGGMLMIFAWLFLFVKVLRQKK